MIFISMKRLATCEKVFFAFQNIFLASFDLFNIFKHFMWLMMELNTSFPCWELTRKVWRCFKNFDDDFSWFSGWIRVAFAVYFSTFIPSHNKPPMKTIHRLLWLKIDLTREVYFLFPLALWILFTSGTCFCLLCYRLFLIVWHSALDDKSCFYQNNM